MTPVCFKTLNILLEGYDKEKKEHLVNGFKNGFKIGYQGSRCFRSSANLKSASEQTDEVDKKINKEVEAGRVAGPFPSTPFKNLQISPIGIVPKKDSGAFRLIHHLSFPEGNSINDHITDDMKTVSYASVDDAIQILLQVGKNAYMCKTDISNAFRIIPIHPDDFELLGIKWKGNFFYDRCLPFGCSSSCAIFENFSSALQWMAQNKCNIPHIVHLLDDFLIISPPNRDLGNKHLEIFLKLCSTLGVPIKEEKTEYAQTTMTFLGIELDSVAMEARLPPEKIKKIQDLLLIFKRKKKATLKELQSLIGLLNFACCVVLPGRTFLRRLIDLTRGVTKPFYHISLNKESRLDLEAWFQFITHFNGKNMFLDQIWQTSSKLNLFTDAAGSLGFGALFEKNWFYGSFPEKYEDQSIAFKELFPIVIAVSVWGQLLSNKCVLFHSDNQAVVHIINKQSSKDKDIMKLVRKLVINCMKHNILMKAEHIPGHHNILADLLSRFQIKTFREQAGCMNQEPTFLEPEVLDV